MGITFDKEQIVSSTELLRSFGKYLDKDLHDHDIFIFKRNAPEAVLVTYQRYEKMKTQLQELKELLEHLAIHEIIETRKESPEKEISLGKLKEKYGL